MRPLYLGRFFLCFHLHLLLSSLRFHHVGCIHILLHEAGPRIQTHKEEYGFSVVFTFNTKFRKLAANLVANMRFHQLTNEIAGATEKSECDYLENTVQDRNILCVTYDSDVYREDYELEPHRGLSAASKDILRKRHFKEPIDIRWLIIRQVRRFGNAVLWLDTDVVFMQSPRSTLKALDAAGVDVAINSDNWRTMTPEFNVGVGYLRNASTTLRLAEDMWIRLVNKTLNANSGWPQSFDQRIFTDAVESMLGDVRSFRSAGKCAIEPMPNTTVEPFCHFDARATERLNEAYRTRKPVTYKNFTLQMVSDLTFGFQRPLWEFYEQHRLNSTRPALEDLPAVVHVRGIPLHHNGAENKMQYLQMFGLWHAPQEISRSIPKSPLVEVNVSDLRDDKQLAELIDLCTSSKENAKVVALSSQDCSLSTTITVFNWPRLDKFACYDHMAHQWAGTELLKTTVKDSCEKNTIFAFEVPYFLGTQNNSLSQLAADFKQELQMRSDNNHSHALYVHHHRNHV
ncbi:hypothetical protein CYMTET_37009 [Cymbomonas tetramitiformis]|uniref:Glycosyltransferase n=1 Tax=Cymbomonas tetramitiformis TaxID=36881 RepID=A0AAE0F6W0_9CHLO|nr:hypothetical protein CYMTET_37009 [Cymbomonas tetramitiformis]